MAEPITYLDQIVNLSDDVRTELSEDPYVVGLILDKPFTEVTDDDKETCRERYILDYAKAPNTITSADSYIFIDVEVQEGDAKENILMARVFLTILCQDGIMNLDRKIFPGIKGNRRDNITRFADKHMRETDFQTIGRMNFLSTSIISSYNNFIFRELVYDVADFHMVRELGEIPGGVEG